VGRADHGFQWSHDNRLKEVLDWVPCFCTCFAIHRPPRFRESSSNLFIDHSSFAAVAFVSADCNDNITDYCLKFIDPRRDLFEGFMISDIKNNDRNHRTAVIHRNIFS
jgi:hypothetical protein